MAKKNDVGIDPAHGVCTGAWIFLYFGGFFPVCLILPW